MVAKVSRKFSSLTSWIILVEFCQLSMAVERVGEIQTSQESSAAQLAPLQESGSLRWVTSMYEAGFSQSQIIRLVADFYRAEMVSAGKLDMEKVKDVGELYALAAEGEAYSQRVAVALNTIVSRFQ